LPKRHIPPIDGTRVRLRLLEEADLPSTLAWRNQDQIRRWFFHSDLISPEQHQAWFEQYRHRDDDFVFVIEEVKDLGRVVGQVAIYNVDWFARRGEFGRLMIGDRQASGKGLAGEATGLAVDFAFWELDLLEVYLEVLADNRPARSIYEACGFHIVNTTGNVVAYSKGRVQ